MTPVAVLVVSVDCAAGRHHLCRPDRDLCECACHAAVAVLADRELSSAGRPAADASLDDGACVHDAATSTRSADTGAADGAVLPVTDLAGEVRVHTRGVVVRGSTS